MERIIDIENHPELLNEWIRKSMELFKNSSYLDRIQEVYPLQISAPVRLEQNLRRKIIMAHQGRNTKELIKILKGIKKFPYEDPMWYLIRNIEGCMVNNPAQIKRIANSLYSMTAEETVVRLEAAPKLNTQIGPMFNDWLKNNFKLLNFDKFSNSTKGIFVLDASEQEGEAFINNHPQQNLYKRPDLVAKVNRQYIIGEAKWIGQPGGNQLKQVKEVLDFCQNQRNNILRIGIIDGFPWALKYNNGNIINSKVAAYIQEAEYDIISALLLKKYFQQI